jgi:hypothetical protein
MSKVYEALDDRLKGFIAAQKLFFVATAPLSGEGHVNLSPKGYDSFRVLDDLTVAYLDLGGSGVETLAHVRENGRITLMFVAFEGQAKILRLYGEAQAVTMGEPGFDELLALFPGFVRARAVIRVRLTRIADSCGWGVPFLAFTSERDQLERYIAHQDHDAWVEKRYAKDCLSIDRLPGLVRPK